MNSPLNVYTPRICLDFDGVIHAYTSGWQGFENIPDPPVEGAFMAIISYLQAGLEVAVFSSRSHRPEAVNAMKMWFLEHGMPQDILAKLVFPTEKPPAILYVDDRAWAFNGPGDFPSPTTVRQFQPWNKTPQANAPDETPKTRPTEYSPSRIPSQDTGYSMGYRVTEDDGYPD